MREADHPVELIVIVGFMGSGKTTVARELAQAPNCRAIDLDELITERQQRTPGQIIDQTGEIEFRKIETETLREILAEETRKGGTLIIGLGGGAWIQAENRALIAAQGGLTIWLDAPFELCWQRIEEGTDLRPLARSREAAERLFTNRQERYQLARIRVPISASKTVSETTAEVAAAARLAGV